MDAEALEANETIDDETMKKLNGPSDNPLQGKQVTNLDMFWPIWLSFD